MPYPCKYTNTETNKTYNLSLGEKGKLTEIKAVCSAEDWGAVDWEIVDQKLLLHTIQSHPEKGTGLGSLLMHLVALEALAAKCTQMQILSAAQNERDFYAMMGCVIDTSALSAFNKNDFSANEWAQLSSSCPVVADAAEVITKSSRSVYKRWCSWCTPEARSVFLLNLKSASHFQHHQLLR